MVLKKTLLYLTIAAVIVVVGYVIFIAGTGPFSRGNTIIPTFHEVYSTPTPEVPESLERPPSLMIEIREDRIVYNYEEVSLAALEAVLVEFGNLEDIWILKDAFHADKYTYDKVRALLTELTVLFAEQ